MPSSDPFALMARLRDAPLGPLVDTLRRVHQGGLAGSEALEHLLGVAGGAPAATTAAPAATPAAPAVTRRDAPDYEVARRHFIQHSERLRDQAMLAERLLDGLAAQESGPPLPALQQTLRLQCQRGGASAARFVVANGLDEPADVHFRAGHVHGLSAAQGSAIRVSFEPAQAHLQPGTEREFQAQIEVDDAEGLPAILELGVDVLGNDRVLLKIWVRTELRAQASHE